LIQSLQLPPIAQISNAAFGQRFQNMTANDPNNGVNDFLIYFKF
jgi:hypothetical protein